MLVCVLVMIYLTKFLGYGRNVYDSHNFQDSKKIYKNDNLITVDIKNHRSTSKIKYEYDRRTDSHTFTARSPYLIEAVTRADRIIWDCADHGYQYGAQVFVGRDEDNKRMFRVFFHGDFIPQIRHPFQFERHSRSSPIHHPTDYSAGDLVLLNVKNRHSTRTVHYKFDSRKNTHTFTARRPNLFGLILKGDKIVWQGARPYPDVVVLFPRAGGGYVMRVYFPSERVLPSLRPSHVPSWPDPGAKYALEPDSLLYKYRHALLVELNINNLSSAKSHTYSTHKNVKTFKAKPNYYFKTVKKGDTFIWSAGETKDFAAKVDLIRYNFPQMYEVNIFTKNGNTRKFVNNKNVHWEEVDMDDELPMMVSMNSEHETFSYTNTLEGSLRTLAAKPGFCISAVVEWLSASDRPVVWKASTDAEYAFKVEVRKQKRVEVFFKNGATKVIVKEADGSWD